MKLKQKLIMILLFLLLSPIIIRNGFDVFSGIKDSHHDFTNQSWTNNETCIACHTPHNAIASTPPLWNHQLSAASYTPYSSSTLNATIGQPSAESKLCLSCHDGTVAMDNIGGNTTGTTYITPGRMGYTGTDLSIHHPISFTYDAALAAADGQLADPSSDPSGLGGTIDEDLLSNGQMQCSSCHDVHISRNTQGCSGCHNIHIGTTVSLSIRVPNENSALCLTCHKK